MSAITKERIKLFIKNPLDNGLTRGEQMELARIALASLEAEPVAVNDDMAYAFHHALSDSSLGADEVEEIKAGLRAAFANVTIQPEPVVPAVLERLRTIVADPRALPRRKEWVSGQQYSYVLLENVEAMVDEACRAAMLHGAEPISQTYKLNQLSGNSPVTPDGWISCSERMPAQDDWILIYSKHGEYMAGQVQEEYVELSDGTLSWLGNALFWMPLPEPPQEAK
ncbi:TPA: DUF551 domain-containing protein [Escherichia coli]|nr:DUF551 domain-containing protein [Escherichia coli]HAX2132860.1 DUF551 domain-containing protein [Escherichia coli]HDN1285920.1 DUF551 domain-containing protein [Escherichia coli]